MSTDDKRLGAFKELLGRYVERLEAGQFLAYPELKALLKILNSTDDPEVYRSLRRAFQDNKHELLDRVVETHEPTKKVRDRIEDERRAARVAEPDWYGAERVEAAGPGERRTTELISAVDMIYALVFRAKCRGADFERLLGVDETTVLDLARLISAFTGDFKLLELYLRFGTRRSTRHLMWNVLNWLPAVRLRTERYTRAEYECLSAIVLESLDADTINDKIDLVCSHFYADDQFALTGDLTDCFSALIVVGLVCENQARLARLLDTRSLSLARFSDSLAGELYVLAKIERVIRRGAGAYKSSPGGAEFANSQTVLTFLLPVLKHAIRTGLGAFESARLRAQADRIDAHEYREYLSSYSVSHGKHYKKLMRYLEFLRGLERT